MYYLGFRANRGLVSCLIAAVAALTICIVHFAPAQAGEGSWTIMAVEGVATVTVQGNEAHAARQGDPVVAGAALVTSEDATVTLTRRGDSVTVYPNSEVTIPETSDSDHSGVIQSLGRLLFRMETRESRNFEVRTPFLAATVKGTVFTVEVAADNATVTVTEGSVLVSPMRGGRSRMVNAGSRASVNTGNVNQVNVQIIAGDAPASGKQGRGRGNPAGGAARDGQPGKGGAQDDGARNGDAQGGGSQGGGPQGGGPQGGGPQGGGSQGGGPQGNQQ